MVSDGEAGVTPFVPSADLSFRLTDGTGRRRQELPWLAMLAAALLHILVLLWLIIDWSHPAAPLAQPEPIPVTVILAPPPQPAPAPPPKPPTPPTYRESGPDQRTTAPPPAETPAPEVASPAPAQPAPEPPAPAEEAMPPPPAEKPAPPAEKPTPRESAKPKPHKEVARIEPPKKEAPTARAPHVAPRQRLDLAPGERAERGDPYLNRLFELLEQHRVFPRVMGQFGLPVEGTAVYDVVLARSGAIMAITLERSSGAAGIDRAGEGMIRSSAPFPPLPPDYPDGIVITITIRLFPPRS